MFVCTCLCPRILTSSYPQVHVPSLAPLHPHIFRFTCSCLYPRTLTSSYYIFISSSSCVLACILASSHPHILRFMCAFFYTCILTSSYPQVHVRLLVSSHPHILVSTVLCVNMFSIRMNNCILASLSSLVLGNCASQFVNNLQILRTGQAFVLDFYHMSRKIYWKQPLRADLKKKVVFKI